MEGCKEKIVVCSSDWYFRDFIHFPKHAYYFCSGAQSAICSESAGKIHVSSIQIRQNFSHFHQNDLQNHYYASITNTSEHALVGNIHKHQRGNCKILYLECTFQGKLHINTKLRLSLIGIMLYGINGHPQIIIINDFVRVIQFHARSSIIAASCQHRNFIEKIVWIR